MKAAGIIAAGWGERLGQKTPKALTPVGSRKLIDFTLDGLEAAGVSHVTCIVNEEARAVPEYVEKSGRKLKMDWIIQTTPSSMHSFLIVLERLASQWSSPVSAGEDPFLITTVDSVAQPSVCRDFLQTCRLFEKPDVCLGLTTHIDDEKPLRVAMRGREGTGLMPTSVQEDPDAWEIVAMTDTGFDSEYVTAGLYGVSPRVLEAKQTAIENNFTALRKLLGHLLKYGSRFYGVPLADVVDVDRPQDIAAAEALLKRR